MSDIYLTKVERKTIFTQGLIYVLFTFVIADLTVTGPEFFNYIPWLYLMGILGVNKFYRPVMTVIITTVTTFISSLFKFNGLSMDCIYLTIIVGVTTLFGIIVGLCVKEFVLEHRLVKHIKIQKKILYIVTIAILTILSFGIYVFRFGNIFSYIAARGKTQDYVKNKFNTTDYNVIDYEHIPWSIDDYVYKIETDSVELDLKVEKEVELLNYEQVQQQLNKKLQEKVEVYAKDLAIHLEAKYEFKNITIEPQGVFFTVRSSAINNEQMESLSEKLAFLVQFNDERNTSISRIVLNIDGIVQVIAKEDFNKITAEYLIAGMEMEIIE
ncbi:MAG: hypothetical protein IKV94_05975 [Clostridia bacterium]|nr:hypothetical protein [Clostridia bacterium]